MAARGSDAASEEAGTIEATAAQRARGTRGRWNIIVACTIVGRYRKVTDGRQNCVVALCIYQDIDKRLFTRTTPKM